MMIYLLGTSLRKALDTVKSAIAAKSTLPVLENVALMCHGNFLEVKANNLEHSVSCNVPISNHLGDSLETTVPGKVFSSFVSKLGDTKVGLGIDGTNRLLVTWNNSEAKFDTLDYAEFPLSPQGQTKWSLVLDSEKFLYGVSSVLHAAATDESRPVLTGVYFKFDGNGLTMAAADGFRLAVFETEAPDDIEPTSFIIPASALRTVIGLLNEGAVKIQITENGYVSFLLPDGDVVQDIEIWTNTIDGKYVDYSRIIPTYENSFTVLTDELKNVLEIASTVKAEGFSKVEFVATGNTMTALTENQSGEAKQVIPCTMSNPESEARFSLRASFLSDGIAALTESCVMHYESEARPVKVTSEGLNYICVIMPMVSK